ncbi:MAG: DnaD domain protein [Chloroflexi bacterium]|nr:DnaD domain protein [Chloroflexota bacterium]
MASFSGFQAGKVRFTRLPDPFFSELLPQIDSLEELKVTLYALWQLDRMEGTVRYLQVEDFSEDEVFMAGLANGPEAREIALHKGIDLAAARGTLLKVELELDGDSRVFYFLNSARGREAIERINAGDWKPSSDSRFPIELAQVQTNIFSLYEQHVGALTPMIADALKNAESEFSELWIEEAIRIAVENNVRKWSYIEAILRRWQEKGRDEGRYQRDTEKDRRKYIEGEFSDFIEH